MSQAPNFPLPTHQPSTFETVYKTIVKLPIPGGGSCSVPADFAPTLVAMEQLVAVVKSLHQTIQQNAAESDDSHADLEWTIDTLLPYVSEEACDVLDTLHGTGGRGERGRRGEPELIAIASLVPRLLWSVMRSSYPVMRLLEGVEVRQYQADQDWRPGMLRLVVLLNLQLPGLNCCFDLTTSQPVADLLEPDSLLQPEESILPLPGSPLTFVVGIDSQQAISAGQQLQALSLQIQGADPMLETLLEGVSVECLHPGQGWQVGQLQLKLGFEFVAQPAPAIGQTTQTATDLVEAELIEDTRLTISSFGNLREVNPMTHVAVIELPQQPLSTAQVRLKTQHDLANPVQASSHHWLEGIANLHPILPGGDRDRTLHQIVKTACGVADARLQSFGSVTQPLRLMDDLLPRLLWQISRSSYEVMQLVGGIEAQVLQPERCWQQGILRLLPNLHIQTPIVDYQIDLTTGQAIPSEAAILPDDAICQQTQGLGLGILPQPNAWVQNPIQVQELMRQLQQQLHRTTPELTLLPQGIEIDWLESNQDWQLGKLQLALDFAFTSERTSGDEHCPW